MIGTFAFGGIQRLAGLSGDGSTRAESAAPMPGFAVGVAEPAHLQIRERYKFRQVISAVIESFRVDRQIERSKGQAELASAKVNFLSIVSRES